MAARRRTRSRNRLALSNARLRRPADESPESGQNAARAGIESANHGGRVKKHAFRLLNLEPNHTATVVRNVAVITVMKTRISAK